MFLQAGLFFASASACEGAGDTAGPVLLEDKPGAVGSKSWPGTVHKHSFP